VASSDKSKVPLENNVDVISISEMKEEDPAIQIEESSDLPDLQYVNVGQDHPESNNQILPFKVLDLTGRIVQQGVFSSGSNQLNVENLIPGVFVLEINDNGNSISRKIIKQ
jgi:uncharacterized surface anchored protein